MPARLHILHGIVIEIFFFFYAKNFRHSVKEAHEFIQILSKV